MDLEKERRIRPPGTDLFHIEEKSITSFIHIFIGGPVRKFRKCVSMKFFPPFPPLSTHTSFLSGQTSDAERKKTHSLPESDLLSGIDKRRE